MLLLMRLPLVSKPGQGIPQGQARSCRVPSPVLTAELAPPPSTLHPGLPQPALEEGVPHPARGAGGDGERARAPC